MDLEKEVSCRLRQTITPGQRVMLGYSGGPDSEALLQLFLSTDLCREYELHVVHVDHGWRAESQQEAQTLLKICQKRGVPFHLETLDRREAKGNLENWSREERYRCFRKVGNRLNTRWLLLGHQKDDLLEVTLKRLMEGAHLVQARGMDFLSEREGLVLVRPLLGIWKEDLLAYLSSKQVSYLEDPTNQDTSFLRASLRHTLFPLLSKTMKKNVRHALCHVALEASLLKEHIDESLEKEWSAWHTDRAVFMQTEGGLSSFLLLQAISRAAQLVQSNFSREQELSAIHSLIGRKGPTLFSKGASHLYVDTNRFLLLRGAPLLPLPSQVQIKEEGIYQVGSWSIRVSRDTLEAVSDSPFHLFEKGFCFQIPSLPLTVLSSTDAHIQRFGASLPRKKATFTLPSSIRRYVPMVLVQNKLVALPARGWIDLAQRGSPFSVCCVWNEL